MVDDETTTSGTMTREKLYELVWAEPMLKVAARYGVSSSYLARVCTLMNVPRPERGYWAKLAVGKAPPIPSLPEPRPGDELEWNKGNAPIRRRRIAPRAPSKNEKRTKITLRKLPSEHPLVHKAKAFFRAGRFKHEAGYLRPDKKLLADFTVTEPALPKALEFANTLFLQLEKKGHRVVIAPVSEELRRAEVDERDDPKKDRGWNTLWSPIRCTVVYVGSVAIGLSVIELSEEVEVRYVNGKYVPVKDYVPPKRHSHAHPYGWTTTKWIPTGRLCLQAFSPYQETSWTKQWRETNKRDLSQQIDSIVREIENQTPNIVGQIKEAERQAEIRQREWEAQKEKWRQEEEIRKKEKALKDSRKDLLKIISEWAEANRIETFFREIELRAQSLSDDKAEAMLERTRYARELVSSADALNHFLEWKSPDER